MIGWEANSLPAVAHRQTRVAAAESVLLELHGGTQARARQRARCDDHVLDLDVLIDALRAKPDGVDRYPAVAQRLDDAAIDAAGVVAAIAQQHDSAQRQIGGLGDQLFQTRADVCRRRDSRAQRPGSGMRFTAVSRRYRRVWNLRCNSVNTPV